MHYILHTLLYRFYVPYNMSIPEPEPRGIMVEHFDERIRIQINPEWKLVLDLIIAIRSAFKITRYDFRLVDKNDIIRFYPLQSISIITENNLK